VVEVTQNDEAMRVWREAHAAYSRLSSPHDYSNPGTASEREQNAAQTAARMIAALADRAKAEGRREMREEAWKAAWIAEPLEAFPVERKDLSAFRYGKDCAVAAIRALDVGAGRA
jgi:hypothetical protein